VTETCDLLAVYVVDAVSADERDEFETHLGGCDACLAEIGLLADTAAAMAETTAVAPPVGLRTQLLAEITRTPQLGPVDTAPQSDRGDAASADRAAAHAASAQLGGVTQLDRHRRPGRRSVLQWGLAAATVGVVGAGAVGTITGWRAAGRRSDAMAAQKDLLAAPDAQLIPVALKDGGQGSYLVSKTQNRALFLAESLPALPAGKLFQQWTVINARPAPDVTFTSADEPVWLTGDVAGAEALAVSVESSAVAATQPTAILGLAKL
jgi:hypothetical protein